MSRTGHIRRNILIVIAASSLTAAGLWWWASTGTPSAEQRYRTEKMVRGNITQTVSANGTLNPVKLISVGTQVSGTVKKLNVDYNDRVSKNQVLVELDDAIFSAQLRQSQANLVSAQSSAALADSNATRIAELFKKEYVSKQEFDQARHATAAARAAVDAARAQVERDRLNLDHTIIRSPVSGVVVDRVVDVGQTVAASFQTPTLFRIAQDLTKMQIDSNFAEADVGLIKVDQKVRFRVDAFADRAFEGRVRQVRLNPTTQQNVVTYNVVVEVDNPDYSLLPGMTAYVSVVVNTKTDVPRIPNAALRFKPAGSPFEAARKGPRGKSEPARATVYALRDGKLTPVQITPGITDGRFTELTAGELSADDALVVEDLTAARPGANGAAATQPGGFRMRMF